MRVRVFPVDVSVCVTCLLSVTNSTFSLTSDIPRFSQSKTQSHTHNTPIPTHSHLHMFTRYSPYICRLLFLIFKWLFFFYFLLIHFLWVVLFALYFRFFILFSFLFLVLYVFFVSENPCVALVVVVSLNRYYYICICTRTFYIYIHISSQYERTVAQSNIFMTTREFINDATILKENLNLLGSKTFLLYVSRMKTYCFIFSSKMLDMFVYKQKHTSLPKNFLFKYHTCMLELFFRLFRNLVIGLEGIFSDVNIT